MGDSDFVTKVAVWNANVALSLFSLLCFDPSISTIN